MEHQNEFTSDGMRKWREDMNAAMKEIDRIQEMKKKHRILTHFNKDLDLPWLAVQTEPGEKRDIGTLMAEECRFLDETGKTFEAKTEREAVDGLIEQLKGIA